MTSAKQPLTEHALEGQSLIEFTLMTGIFLVVFVGSSSLLLQLWKNHHDLYLTFQWTHAVRTQDYLKTAPKNFVSLTQLHSILGSYHQGEKCFRVRLPRIPLQ